MIEIRTALSYDDILLVPFYSDLKSRKDTDPSMFGKSLPIIMSPMDTTTTPEMIKLFYEMNLIPSLHRHFMCGEEQFNYLKDGLNEIIDDNKKINDIIKNTYFSVGSIPKYQKWINTLYNLGVRCFMVDMAHGDSEHCVNTIKYLKNIECTSDNNVNIIAGNVATKSGFRRLQESGANGVRVGIGGGHICKTRISTAFGVPTLTSIMDCEKVKDNNVFSIADGGIKNAGDIVKAIRCGADFCMVGKLLAGTDLAKGTCYNYKKEIIPEGKEIFDIKQSKNIDKDYVVKYREYRGMASREARQGVMNYSSVEGEAGIIEYVGKTIDVLYDIKLNLQAALSYGGSKNWNEFRKKVKIIKLTNSSINEGNIHLDGKI